MFPRDPITLETPSTEAQVDRGPNNRYDAKFMQLGKGQFGFRLEQSLPGFKLPFENEILEMK